MGGGREGCSVMQAEGLGVRSAEWLLFMRCDAMCACSRGGFLRLVLSSFFFCFSCYDTGRGTARDQRYAVARVASERVACAVFVNVITIAVAVCCLIGIDWRRDEMDILEIFVQCDHCRSESGALVGFQW